MSPRNPSSIVPAQKGGRGGGGGGGAPLISETSRLTWDKALFSFPKRECMRTVKNWAWSQVKFWQTRLNWLERLVFIIIVIPTTSANYLHSYLLLRTLVSKYVSEKRVSFHSRLWLGALADCVWDAARQSRIPIRLYLLQRTKANCRYSIGWPVSWGNTATIWLEKEQWYFDQ